MTSAKDWDLIIRRAANIPDIVGDDVANEVLGDLFFAAYAPPDRMKWEPTQVAAALRIAISTAGEAGKLDALIMKRPYASADGLARELLLSTQITADAQAALNTSSGVADVLRLICERLAG